MLRLALLGAGRIGKTHADALVHIKRAQLVAVYDPVQSAAQQVADNHAASTVSIEQIMADGTIDAVLICTPTDQHADHIEMAARAGKAIFCEKPIDLERSRVESCLRVVDEQGAKLMVGFNRRFDANFIALRDNIRNGAIGKAECMQIISRDPAPPPMAYIRQSGGIFRDMMIHDFDLVHFLFEERCVQVTATGSVLIDDEIAALGDFDTATATVKTTSGKIAIISNSRRASYGYDQRIEVHGSKGLVSADNMRPTTVTLANEDGYTSDRLLDFFMDRYAQAYRNELNAFVNAVLADTAISPNGRDGLLALELAEAALRSAQTKRSVELGS